MTKLTIEQMINELEALDMEVKHRLASFQDARLNCMRQSLFVQLAQLEEILGEPLAIADPVSYSLIKPALDSRIPAQILNAVGILDEMIFNY